MNDKPERPLECSECRKKIAVKYTEIVGDTVTHLYMCEGCPEYNKRMHGGAQTLLASGTVEGTLACGNCGTTFDAVRMGNPLGCSVCYEVFGEALFLELLQAKKIPSRITSFKKSTPIHIGRAPGESKEATASMKLLGLNEALSDTLKAENYEQAAFLRDQIRELTDKNPELKEKPTDGG